MLDSTMLSEPLLPQVPQVLTHYPAEPGEVIFRRFLQADSPMICLTSKPEAPYRKTRRILRWRTRSFQRSGLSLFFSSWGFSLLNGEDARAEVMVFMYVGRWPPELFVNEEEDHPGCCRCISAASSPQAPNSGCGMATATRLPVVTARTSPSGHAVGITCKTRLTDSGQ